MERPAGSELLRPRHLLSPLLVCLCKLPHESKPLGTLASPAMTWLSPPGVGGTHLPGDSTGVPPPGSTQVGAAVLPAPGAACRPLPLQAHPLLQACSHPLTPGVCPFFAHCFSSSSPCPHSGVMTSSSSSVLTSVSWPLGPLPPPH